MDNGCYSRGKMVWNIFILWEFLKKPRDFDLYIRIGLLGNRHKLWLAIQSEMSLHVLVSSIIQKLFVNQDFHSNSA
jgi:hypothetical protein